MSTYVKCDKCKKIQHVTLFKRLTASEEKEFNPRNNDNICGKHMDCVGIGYFLDEGDMTQFEKGREAFNMISNGLNIMNGDHPFIAGFCEKLGREHRTLQQNFGRLIITVINQFAENYKKKCFDGRNEAICKMCVNIVEKQEWKDQFLPFI